MNESKNVCRNESFFDFMCVCGLFRMSMHARGESIRRFVFIKVRITRMTWYIQKKNRLALWKQHYHHQLTAVAMAKITPNENVMCSWYRKQTDEQTNNRQTKSLMCIVHAPIKKKADHLECVFFFLHFFFACKLKLINNVCTRVCCRIHSHTHIHIHQSKKCGVCVNEAKHLRYPKNEHLRFGVHT